MPQHPVLSRKFGAQCYSDKFVSDRAYIAAPCMWRQILAATLFIICIRVLVHLIPGDISVESIMATAPTATGAMRTVQRVRHLASNRCTCANEIDGCVWHDTVGSRAAVRDTDVITTSLARSAGLAWVHRLQPSPSFHSAVCKCMCCRARSSAPTWVLTQLTI